MAIEVAHLASDRVPTGLCEFETVFGFLYQAHLDEEVEVFLPSLRWVGFDPTNNVIAGERHIAVAVGRDYGDVPPSRGVYKGEQDSQLVVGVMVRKARATAAEPEFMRLAKPVFPGAVRRRQATSLLELHRDQILQQQQQQQQ